MSFRTIFSSRKKKKKRDETCPLSAYVYVTVNMHKLLSDFPEHHISGSVCISSCLMEIRGKPKNSSGNSIPDGWKIIACKNIMEQTSKYLAECKEDKGLPSRNKYFYVPQQCSELNRVNPQGGLVAMVRDQIIMVDLHHF